MFEEGCPAGQVDSRVQELARLNPDDGGSQRGKPGCCCLGERDGIMLSPLSITATLSDRWHLGACLCERGQLAFCPRASHSPMHEQVGSVCFGGRRCLPHSSQFVAVVR